MAIPQGFRACNAQIFSFFPCAARFVLAVQLSVYWAVSRLRRTKNTVSSRTSSQTGVAIPYGGAAQYFTVNQRICGQNSDFLPMKVPGNLWGLPRRAKPSSQ
jgi:hypothetical protein